MHFCYVDESGDAELFCRDRPDSTPVFTIVGLTVSSAQQKSLIWEFLQLKKEFEPRLRTGRLSDLVRAEIKGSDLRRDVRRGRDQRNIRRRAIGVIDKTIRLLEDHGCQVMGKVVVKTEGRPTRDDQTYPRAVSDMATTFESQLAAANTTGIMILDSRTKSKNEGNVHTITTRRFKTGGDVLPHLLEAPVFGHSDTHVPLQIADIIASAIVFPVACIEYCGEHTWNRHPHEAYRDLKERFGKRLQQLEYRYVDPVGIRRGGFQVVDPVDRRPTHLLFRD